MTNFPSSDFDDWAETYDQDVLVNDFPFTGYTRVLETTVRLAGAAPGRHVLDLGTGTGNLARPFLDLGCQVTATDFSSAMLEKARQRLPGAVLVQADLSQCLQPGASLPPELAGAAFDRVVSGYVFHHFDLNQKVAILVCLERLLAPGGRMVLADISFPDKAALEAVKQAAGEAWEEELYWVAAEAVPAIEAAGFAVAYHQVSPCAGVYLITRSTDRPVNSL